MFTLRCRQADFVARVSEIADVIVTGDQLSPVLLLPAVN
jgi:hypothetical protein